MSLITTACPVCQQLHSVGVVGSGVVGGHECPVKTALVEAEATLKHIQPYVGLIVQYLPDANQRVAAAREQANAALPSPPSDVASSSAPEDDDDLGAFFSEPTVGYCSRCGEARTEVYTCRDGGSTVALAAPCEACAGTGVQLCECDKGKRPITNCFSCSGRDCAACSGTGALALPRNQASKEA